MAISSETAITVVASIGATPYSKAPRLPATPSATAIPAAAPMPASAAPSRATIAMSDPAVAPSAIRTPNSWVRCAIRYARVPYIPMPASSNAAAANAVSISIMKRVSPIEMST